MPTCAIYARVSDESQLRGESIQHQIGFAKTYARRRTIESGDPWETPDELIYVDRGITGTSMVKRDAVRRLIDAAQKKRLDVVLFKGISRFARDTVDALLMLRTLLACQVRVISIEENYDSLRDSAEFVFTIHSALAQAESEKTSIRVRMGAMEKAKSGQWNGRPPDGYRLNRQTKRLEIDELFSPVIREIFRLYQDGYGCRKIASLLNGNSLYTRQGKRWTQRYISRLLKNPVYAGDVVYGRRIKRMAVSDDKVASPRRKTVMSNDENDTVVCRGAHPPIVDRATFDSVNQTLSRRLHDPGRSDVVHLLSRGLLRCACGGSMTTKYNGRQVMYYRCRQQAESGKSVCDMPYVSGHIIERAVLERVYSDTMKILNFSKIPSQSDSHHESSLNRIESERDQYRKRTVQLFEKYAEGDVDEWQFEHLNAFIRQRIKFLNTIERRLLQQAEHAFHWRERDIQSYTEKTIQANLARPRENPHFTRELLRLLVDHVDILPGTSQPTRIVIHYRFHM